MNKTENLNLEELKSYISSAKSKEHPESYLIAILHKAQELYGYLDKNIMDIVSLEMGIPSAHIWGVATFYHYFNLAAVGKHTIFICMGTACFVKGADRILETIKEELNIDIEETTEDGVFTLRQTRCLGACGLAPVIMIDNKIYGDLDSQKVVDILREYRKNSKNIKSGD
jgi:NADH:ubiquinone oxidoreductase subunit E